MDFSNEYFSCLWYIPGQGGSVASYMSRHVPPSNSHFTDHYYQRAVLHSLPLHIGFVKLTKDKHIRAPRHQHEWLTKPDPE